MFNVIGRRTSKSRDSLAREVAERSVAATLQQLTADTDNMTAAEVRGYVRAHALPFVRDEATQLVSREWPPEAYAELVTAALEKVTHLVIQQLKMPPVISMPAAHVERRMAA